jgi:hypothetical protein
LTTLNLSDFFSVATSVYRDDPRYIPEEKDTIRSLFSSENPFFESGTLWGKVVQEEARLIGMVHPDFGNTAYFGFWETVCDFSLNQELFAEFEDWAKTLGCHRVEGPINFSTFFTYRILIDGMAHSLPFPREPYSPTYYPDILLGLGYSLSQSYFSDFVSSYDFSTTDVSLQTVVGTTIHPLSKTIWESRFDDFLVAIQKIFSKKEYYSPSQLAVCSATNYAFIGRLLCPNASFYATNQDGHIIGIYIVMPHYGELTCQGRPNCISIHDIDYDRHYPQLNQKIALIKTIGVTPEWAKTSLFFALSQQALSACRQFYPDGGIMALTSELTRRLIPGFVVQSTARYGVFAKNLDLTLS